MKLSRRSARTILMAVPLLGALGLGAGVAQAAPPGPAAQVAPQGALTGTTIIFTWEAAPGATWYFFHLNDAATVGKLMRWYTADEVHCAGGAGTCVLSVTLGLAPGPGMWWVRPWNPEGFGPWSGGLDFTVAALPPSWAATLPAAQRFQLVLGGAAVLDRETGLVWERSPDTTTRTWVNAQSHCNTRTVGNRKGWRLPTIQELASLIDPTVATSPTLPAGHPFTNVQSSFYWSASTDASDTSRAWGVNLLNGNVNSVDKTLALFVWCVRGGPGVDPQ
jgi:hypothetical protein